MKKFLSLFIIVLVIHSCNNNKHKTESDHKDHATTTPVEDNKIEHSDLVLNNGEKWKADGPTKKNAGQLQLIISDFQKVAHSSLDAHHLLADKLQGSLDVMIKECKMKGPDHDALHVWLMPLITYTKTIKSANEISSVADLQNKISDQISMFPKYFE